MLVSICASFQWTGSDGFQESFRAVCVYLHCVCMPVYVCTCLNVHACMFLYFCERVYELKHTHMMIFWNIVLYVLKSS